MLKLEASVKYGDWEGTAAADDLDLEGMGKFLKGKGLIHDGELLVAISFDVGENHPDRVQDPTVYSYVIQAETFKEAREATAESVKCRRIETEMTIMEFIGLFKRFNVVLTAQGLDLAGREFSVDEH